VAHLDVLQILDEQILDVSQPFQDVVLQFLVDVVVDAEPHHLLKMDCFLDEVDVVPHHLQRMDYFLDEEPLVLEVLGAELLHFLLRDLPPRAWQPLPYLPAP
jgi:hypothetical protein